MFNMDNSSFLFLWRLPVRAKKKNLLEEIVVKDVIGQGNFKTVLSYFRARSIDPIPE